MKLGQSHDIISKVQRGTHWTIHFNHVGALKSQTRTERGCSKDGVWVTCDVSGEDSWWWKHGPKVVFCSSLSLKRAVSNARTLWSSAYGMSLLTPNVDPDSFLSEWVQRGTAIFFGSAAVTQIRINTYIYVRTPPVCLSKATPNKSRSEDKVLDLRLHGSDGFLIFLLLFHCSVCLWVFGWEFCSGCFFQQFPLILTHRVLS